MITQHGYVKIRVGRKHILADKNGYAYEHLVVWVSHGMGGVPEGFLLHHKNENKQDNRIENLECISRSCHNKLHNQSKVRDPKTGRFTGSLLDGVEHKAYPQR